MFLFHLKWIPRRNYRYLLGQFICILSRNLRFLSLMKILLGLSEHLYRYHLLLFPLKHCHLVLSSSSARMVPYQFLTDYLLCHKQDWCIGRCPHRSLTDSNTCNSRDIQDCISSTRFHHYFDDHGLRRGFAVGHSHNFSFKQLLATNTIKL